MKRLLRLHPIVLLLIAGLPASLLSQSGMQLSQVKTLYVDTFNAGNDSASLRDSVIRHLSRSHRFQLVSSASNADAIVKGASQIWIRGYVSANARNPGNDRQAVYGGYLSLQLTDANGQPLWSWLATPDRHAWSGIADDLAGRAVEKLLEAENSPSTASSTPAAVNALAHTDITGAGATFPAPLYQKWFEDFEQIHKGVHVRYSPVGSQIGVDNLLAGKIDFAGSDTAPEVFNPSAPGSHLLRIASVLGAVVPVYHLNGSVQDLHFTPEALAGIYLGRIRRWDDPEIRRSNKGAALPAAEIHVIHRSDGSGTTWVWSDYLSKVSPEWSSKLGRGATLQWPTGTGAQGSEGIAEAVQKTPNSIGYVELAYAIQHQLSFAAVRNRSGAYVHADLDSLAEAAAASRTTGNTAADITDPSGKNAYPIAAYTWLLLPEKTEDPARKAALKELLRWILTTGQRECSALGYDPLPKSIVDSQLQRLSSLP
ncbi:phosphate ABC transporter substrate-binding protein PstS [Acidicapsa dinghuensis]|uniref:Phosphate-binding protein PstS n=2 Tax=Acidicapsa dinghuensis TaxID=2218256 RepID=A0ABW1ELQ9_9BACT|nr:phosphate ABC transporter substrate-binding protein PstS [Acidicapsa dinghuensis]